MNIKVSLKDLLEVILSVQWVTLLLLVTSEHGQNKNDENVCRLQKYLNRALAGKAQGLN